MHYIYKIIYENKVYIGQTVDMKRRMQAHKSFAKNPEKSGQYIHRAMNKYGVENFSFNIIDFALNQWQADCLEENYIKQYDSRNKKKGYNIVPGGNNVSGSNHPAYGTKISEDHKKVIGIASATMWQNEEYRMKMLEIIKPTQFKKGHVASEEVKNNISKSNLGRAAWNKGTKDIMKSNRTSFKVGENTGEQNKNSKVNWLLVNDIRKDYKNGVSLTKLCNKYSMITKSTIYNIIKYKTWK